MKLKTIFSPRKIFIVITMLILALSLGVLQKPAESVTRAVVTMLAIEEKEGEIIAVAKILTPGTPGSKSEKIFVAVGNTVSCAMDNIALQVGKDLGLAHCEAILVGDNLAQHNLLDSLDYLTRTKKVSRSVLLINFGGDIVDLMKAILYINDNLSLKLEQVIDYDDMRVFNSDGTVESFYQKYYGDIQFAVVPKIEITDEENSGLEIQASTQGSSSSSNSIGGQSSAENASFNNSHSKYLKNDGTTSIFKQAKKIGELTREKTEDVNWFAKKSQNDLLVLENVSGEEYDNATVYFNGLKIENDYTYKFIDGIPTIKVKLNILGEIQQIIQEGESQDFLKMSTSLFNKTLQKAISDEVTETMKETFKMMQDNQLDIINIYEKFNKFCHEDFKKYIDQLEDKNDYLKNMKLEVKVKSSLAL